MSSSGRYQVLGALPPEQPGRTVLAVESGPSTWQRLVVARPMLDATIVPAPSLHPRLLTPLGFDDFDGQQCVVWDFVAGVTLREIVDAYRAQNQLPPLGLIARAVIDAARVMTFAHEHNHPIDGPQTYVHGGLSDRTVLMGFDGQTRVLDFGVRGKSRFSAPELQRGGPVDARTDVFSLAAVLHAGLTGFDRSYAQVLAKTPSTAEFPPPTAVHPDASQPLDAVVMRALFHARESRLTSTAELADDLERIVGLGLPRAEACGVRLKQLFEARIEAVKAMSPPRQTDPSLASSRPLPRKSRPSIPKLSPEPELPPAYEPEIAEGDKTIGIPDFLKGPPDSDKTQVGVLPASMQQKTPKGTVPGTVPWEDKSDGRGQGLEQYPPPDITSEPTTIGLRYPVRTQPVAPSASIPEADAEDVQSFDSDAEEEGASLAEYGDVPTSAPRRGSGEKGLVKGQSAQERALARGQELVQTGEIEIPEELRQPEFEKTVVRPAGVRLSGEHPRLEPSTQDLEPGGRRNERKKAEGDGAAQPEQATEDAGLKAAPKRGPKIAIAALVLLIVSGAAVAVLRPDLVARLKGRTAPPPQPDLPMLVDFDAGEDEVDAGPLVVGDEADVAPLVAPSAEVDAGEVAAPAPAVEDAGEEIDEDDDGGVVTADDGGTSPAPHLKKRRRHR